MKKRIGTYVTSACVAGLLAGTSFVALPSVAVADSGAIEGGAASSWNATSGMQAGLQTSSLVQDEPIQCLYGPPSLFEEYYQTLYGPPPVDIKKENPMVVRVANKRVKASRLRKGKKTFTKAIKVKKAKGSVIFTKLKEGSSSALKVNKKTGAITVAKGTKRGLYTINVMVSASGNSKYFGIERFVTLKVRVK